MKYARKQIKSQVWHGRNDRGRIAGIGPELKQGNRGETKHLLFGGCFAWHSRAETKQETCRSPPSYGRIGGLRHAPPLAVAQHKWSQKYRGKS